MNTYRGRRVVSECGGYVTYVPVDPKTELPEYIVEAPPRPLQGGSLEALRIIRDDY